MMNYVFVALGAALGGAARYGVYSAVARFSSPIRPIGTLAVNVVGSFLLGVLIFAFRAESAIDERLKLLLTVGFCGGFTTFSTFSLETAYLVRREEYWSAAANAGLNVFLTIAGVAAGYFVVKKWFPA
jgi:fluoride exporter